MVALGVAYGYLAPHLQHTPLGIYGYAVLFFIFFAFGKVMHRVASYKLGAKVLGTAVLGLAVGLAIGPFRELILSAMASSSADGAADGSDYVLSTYLVNLAIMAFGVLSPYFRKS
jgi:hypothetical protein